MRTHLAVEVKRVSVGGKSAVETMDTPQERDLDPLLFPRMRDGNNNELVRACRPASRAFRAGVLTQQIAPYSVEIDEGTSAEDLSKA